LNNLVYDQALAILSLEKYLNNYILMTIEFNSDGKIGFRFTTKVQTAFFPLDGG